MKVCRVTSEVVDGKLKFTIVEPVHEVSLSEIIKTEEYQRGLRNIEYIKKLTSDVQRYYPRSQQGIRLHDDFS